MSDIRGIMSTSACCACQIKMSFCLYMYAHIYWMASSERSQWECQLIHFFLSFTFVFFSPIVRSFIAGVPLKIPRILFDWKKRELLCIFVNKWFSIKWYACVFNSKRKISSGNNLIRDYPHPSSSHCHCFHIRFSFVDHKVQKKWNPQPNELFPILESSTNWNAAIWIHFPYFKLCWFHQLIEWWKLHMFTISEPLHAIPMQHD